MYPQPELVSDDRFFRGDGRQIVCPFGVPGDRLWVRERFATGENGDIVYAADPVKRRSRFDWRQSRYLPRESSRLTLLVLSTRPQRLREINEADARAEGYDAAKESLSPIDWFARLWDRLSVVKSLRWDANPWLWVVHFELMTRVDNQPSTESFPLFEESAVQKIVPDKSSRRAPRTATMEERHRLAAMLRSRVETS
jgi:hypothetical protein